MVYEEADKPNLSDYVDEFVANDSSHKSKDGNNIIKRSALIPTPGCRQYDSYPVVVNKEDFKRNEDKPFDTITDDNLFATSDALLSQNMEAYKELAK